MLDGVKQFISGAGSSDVYVVMARTGFKEEQPGHRGISAFIVEKDTPGLSFGAQEEKMGWNAQPTAQVILEGARVPADAMLGGPDGEGTGFGIAMNGLNGGRLNIAACSLGGAQAAYDKAAGYLADRQAFGGALLDEPTIRFTLADMATALETSRLMLWRAAVALDDGEPDKVELCAMAKRYVTDACFDVADQASAAARRLRLPAGVRAREDRPRSAGAPDPGGHQRNHARGHRAGRGRPGPRNGMRQRSLRMTTIAFLGLGNMGGPMAANLVDAGHTVRGFDPVPALRQPRQAKGATVFDSGAEAVAEADVVITSLPNGAIVKALLRRGAAGRQGGRAVHRHLDDLGRRRPRGQRAGRGSGDWPSSTPRSPAASRARRRARWPSWSAARLTRWRRLAPVLEPDGGQGHSLRRRPARGRPPRCATTWCSRCSRSRSARRSCWPRSSACRRSRCST